MHRNPNATNENQFNFSKDIIINTLIDIFTKANLKSLSGNKSNLKIADLGCGTTAWCVVQALEKYFNGIEIEYVGIEIDDEYVVFNRKMYQSKNAKYIQHDATKKLPAEMYSENYFDIVLFFHPNVCHEENGFLLPILNTIPKLIQQDGVFILTLQNPEELELVSERLLPEFLSTNDNIKFQNSVFKEVNTRYLRLDNNEDPAYAFRFMLTTNVVHLRPTVNHDLSSLETVYRATIKSLSNESLAKTETEKSPNHLRQLDKF